MTTVIFDPGSLTYTPQTINQKLFLGGGIMSLGITASCTDPSWTNAAGTIATISLFDPHGNPLGGGSFSGGIANLPGGVTASTRTITTTAPGGVPYQTGDYSVTIVISQTVTSTVQAFTNP